MRIIRLEMFQEKNKQDYLKTDPRGEWFPSRKLGRDQRCFYFPFKPWPCSRQNCLSLPTYLLWNGSACNPGYRGLIQFLNELLVAFLFKCCQIDFKNKLVKQQPPLPAHNFVLRFTDWYDVPSCTSCPSATR